jgi:hypothetical protein
MIGHVVFFSARDKNNIAAVITDLSVLQTNPYVYTIEISRNLQADELTGGMLDVIVYAEFADENQLAVYKAYPVYRQSIAMVRPLRKLCINADFIVN